MVSEKEIVKTIVISTDWEEVIMNIIEQEGLDPWSIDIVKLVNAFFSYLRTMRRFDFRIPARFILVAAILLRMKCEFSKAEPQEKEEKIPDIGTDVPLLEMPILRRPKRKITVSELVTALKKVMEFEERKKRKKLTIRRKIDMLIEEKVEDIRERMREVFERIKANNVKRFSDLVGEWKRNNITKTFIPLLHLSNEGFVSCNQPEQFGEIYIEMRRDDFK